MDPRLLRRPGRAHLQPSTKALNTYANAVRLQLPNFWQPSPGTLLIVQSNLRAFSPNAYGFVNPEEWYFTKS